MMVKARMPHLSETEYKRLMVDPPRTWGYENLAPEEHGVFGKSYARREGIDRLEGLDGPVQRRKGPIPGYESPPIYRQCRSLGQKEKLYRQLSNLMKQKYDQRCIAKPVLGRAIETEAKPIRGLRLRTNRSTLAGLPIIPTMGQNRTFNRAFRGGIGISGLGQTPHMSPQHFAYSIAIIAVGIFAANQIMKAT